MRGQYGEEVMSVRGFETGKGFLGVMGWALVELITEYIGCRL